MDPFCIFYGNGLSLSRSICLPLFLAVLVFVFYPKTRWKTEVSAFFENLHLDRWLFVWDVKHFPYSLYFFFLFICISQIDFLAWTATSSIFSRDYCIIFGEHFLDKGLQSLKRTFTVSPFSRISDSKECWYSKKFLFGLFTIQCIDSNFWSKAGPSHLLNSCVHRSHTLFEKKKTLRLLTKIVKLFKSHTPYHWLFCFSHFLILFIGLLFLFPFSMRKKYLISSSIKKNDELFPINPSQQIELYLLEKKTILLFNSEISVS